MTHAVVDAGAAVSVSSSITRSTTEQGELSSYPKLQSLLATDANKVSIQSKAFSQGAKGTKEKRKILAAYEDRFRGDNPESIIIKKKGKVNVADVPCNSHNLFVDRESDYLPSRRMRPSLNKQYRVDNLSFQHVLAIILKEQHSSFSEQDICALKAANTEFLQFVPAILRWLLVDFSSLSQPRYNYEDQTQVDNQRVEMASAAMIHFGLHPGKLVRYLGGEYTGSNRDAKQTVAALHGLISDSDLYHVKRILLQGCPSELVLFESSESKLAMIRRGNQKSFAEYPDIVTRTINKEERYSHILPMNEIICKLSPYVRHTSQGMVVKEGKNPRVVWDGSTKQAPLDVVMNEVTPTMHEAEITFGDTKKKFLTDLYNLRISNPLSMILMALADVKACFRFGRIHPDLTGAFGFLADGFYNLATSMVFGSNTSASSWEPFRRAIEALSAKFSSRDDLVQKHRRFLDMVRWSDDINHPGPFVKACACAVNPGSKDSSGIETSRPARIYVDDALMAAIGKANMERMLAATIEAIFIVMGDANEAIRQCPLAMDKWQELVVGPRQVILGLTVDTRTMTVAITSEYREEVARIIKSTWHVHRRRFYASEAQQLVGKLARIAEAAPWVFHLLSHLYSSIAHALSGNKLLLEESSDEFRAAISAARSTNYQPEDKDRFKKMAFAIKQAAKMVHHSRAQYNISTRMRSEIEFFRTTIEDDSTIVWETPIAHLIPRTPSAVTLGDSCLDGAGGYSIGLGFWWHLAFPHDVVIRTLKHNRDGANGALVSINVLEFVTVIINYCAATQIMGSLDNPFPDDPHPVLLNITDNRSALNWTLHSCQGSPAARLLARLFCYLQINSPVGINSKWIPTDENKIADDISRIKRQKQISSNNDSQQTLFDYSILLQTYPVLRHCSFFQIEPELISLIWEIVLTEKWPCLERIRILKRKPLGKLITSAGRN